MVEHDLGPDTREVDLAHAEIAQQLGALEVGLDRRGSRLRRVLLQREELGAVTGDLQEVVDGHPLLLRQPLADGPEQVALRARRRPRGHPLEGRARRDDDAAQPEVLLGLADEFVGEQPPRRAFAHPHVERLPGCVVQGGVAEMGADPLLVLEVGRLPRRGRDEQHGRAADLSTDVVHDPDGDRVVLVRAQEATEATQHAELKREAVAFVGTSAAAHLDQVLFAERPVARQLFVRRIDGQADHVSPLRPG